MLLLVSLRLGGKQLFIKGIPKYRTMEEIMRIAGAVVVLCSFWMVPSLVSAAEPVVGEVVQFSGGATATRAAVSRDLALNALLHAGDRIATGPKTRVKFRLTDGTLVTLGDNTEFTLVAYGYDAKAQTGRAVLELAKGFFRTVTGAIAKLKKPEFEVKTPVATLGIRGTDFWGELTAQGLRVALISGRVVTVTNHAGSVEIAQPGWGTTVTAVDAAPREPFKWSDAALSKAMGTVD